MDVADGAGRHGDTLDAVGLVDALLPAVDQPEDLAGTHWRLAVPHAPVAVLALATALAQLGGEAIDGGVVHPIERESAERRQQLLVGVAAVVDERVRRDGTD